MRDESLSRRIAIILWWAGLAALITAGAAFALRLPIQPSLWAAGGIIALGINTLLAGDLVVGPSSKTFIARGQVVRGYARARTGLCDMQVGNCPNDRIAVMRYGPLGKPRFEVEDGIAYMTLNQSVLRPNVTTWGAGLAGNILWDVEVSSSLGDLTLNLTDLRLEFVKAQSRFGRISVVCPKRGYAQVTLRNRLGDTEVIIPPEAGIRLIIKAGKLSNLDIKNERLEALDHRRFQTPDFDTAPCQVEMTIQTGAGDVLIS